MKYLFKNGTVVSGRGTRRADVLVENEKILQVGRNLSDPLARAIDVTGKHRVQTQLTGDPVSVILPA